MPKIFTYTEPLHADMIDAFCVLQKEFTDQFVYYEKGSFASTTNHATEDPQETDRANDGSSSAEAEEGGTEGQRFPARLMGLGRCIAVRDADDIEAVYQGPCSASPVLFSFNRFDAENPRPADELFQAFPKLSMLLPEVVLVDSPQGPLLQVNSLGPVYAGRVERFARRARQAKGRTRVTVPYSIERDDPAEWQREVEGVLSAIDSGRVSKTVLSRRVKLKAQQVFSSKDLLVNLIDGPSKGTVFLYRYGDVFFCGCTPELLVRKRGLAIESECLAGTTGVGSTEEETARLARELLADDKNRREHAFVVDFIRSVVDRNCHAVRIPSAPVIKRLQHVQHLQTPVRAKVMEGRSVENLAGQLMPTPALAGMPVGESLMLLRETEPYNRGFFGGSVGYRTADGDGAFSVAIRCGVFDGEIGWLYAGCGIVAGSDASSEYDEIDMKLQTILSAFEGKER
ncbi:isochorismate synthase [Hugonella massiliensis]|uniref:isochorismate synthase n=1 Tax=Hugonella massiliensis TaxID=1720315 RepID=UPI00073E3716|nr:isochorismate synthase [Hugonella massiliensis]